MTHIPDDEQKALLEAGRKLFALDCQFFAGTETLMRLPDATLPEVAFAGRSNVGKSSLVNALTGRKTLARTSNTPGRTQQINFFDLGHRLILVDLPGYGYAKVSKEKVAGWTDVIERYLKGRQTLVRVCVLIDGRHGVKDTDQSTMKLLDQSAVPYFVVLTKADKVKPPEMEERVQQIETSLKKHTAAYPTVFVTSSETGQGIEELRAHLAAFAV